MMLLRRKKNKNKLSFILVSIAIVSLLAIVLFDNFPPTFVKKSALFVSQPLISLKDKFSNGIDCFNLLWKTKVELQNENIFLKQELMGLKTKEELSSVVFEENKRLKLVLFANEDKDFLLATILLRPGYGVNNSLVIDAGSKKGIKRGMPVTAFGAVLLGYVFEASSDISRIKLISFPEEEVNVFIDGRIVAIAVGLGTENLEIILPRDVEIKVGDKVTTFGVNPFYLGIIERIEKEPTSAFQKAFFRLPINIQELREVYLVK